MSNSKPEFTLWGEDNPGKELVDAAWTGTKVVAGAVVIGLALGLGIGAFNSASG